jgi:hypothetical protein
MEYFLLNAYLGDKSLLGNWQKVGMISWSSDEETKFQKI